MSRRTTKAKLKAAGVKRLGCSETRAFNMPSWEFAKLPARWRYRASRDQDGMPRTMGRIRRSWDAFSTPGGSCMFRVWMIQGQRMHPTGYLP